MAYNGWENYQTWAVNLWLNNDQATQEHLFEMAKDAMQASPIVKRKAEYILADNIEDYVEDNNPLLEQNSMFTDMLNHAIANVAWLEIAEGTLEEQSFQQD